MRMDKKMTSFRVADSWQSSASAWVSICTLKTGSRHQEEAQDGQHTHDGRGELLEPRREPGQVPLAAQARMIALELLALSGQRLRDVPAANSRRERDMTTSRAICISSTST